MKSDDLFALIGEVDEKKIPILNEMKNEEKVTEKEVFHMKKKWQRWLKIGVAVACTLLVMGAGIQLWKNWKNNTLNGNEGLEKDFELSSNSSDGMSVNYTSKPKISTVNSDLDFFTEEEIFGENEWSDVICRGTIEEIKNIVCDFNGEKEYRGRIRIRVNNVYRGDAKEEGKIVVLLPYAVDDSVWVEDTETLTNMQEGMEGIFLLNEYNEKSIWQQNGETLALKDVAQYGFGDGVQWAFLDTDHGLVFSRNVYQGALEAEDLDDIEEYVLEMLANKE